jgi:hypothetical protein
MARGVKFGRGSIFLKAHVGVATLQPGNKASFELFETAFINLGTSALGARLWFSPMASYSVVITLNAVLPTTVLQPQRAVTTQFRLDTKVYCCRW